MAYQFKSRGLGGTQAATHARPAGYYSGQPGSHGLLGDIEDKDLGRAADEVGGMQLAGGAAKLTVDLVKRGIAGGLSDKTIRKQIDRASSLLAGGPSPSNIHMSDRSFSASVANKGLKENFGALLKESTNSFFRGNNGWWDRAVKNQPKKAGSFYFEGGDRGYDKSVGLPVHKGFDALTTFPGGVEDTTAPRQNPGMQDLERAQLSIMGAGGDLFDYGVSNGRRAEAYGSLLGGALNA